MTVDLVTFGETMIRLSPPGHRRLEQTDSLCLHVGGSEMNAAVAAARLGLGTAYITRLTRNPLGRLIAGKAREHGVDTSWIVWSDEERVGTYYVEFGASPRPNTVLYDRKGSAFAHVQRGQVDWRSALENAKVFHTSGITFALSDSAADATFEALETARRLGLKISIDLNYRARLWSQDRARTVMTKAVGMADILIRRKRTRNGCSESRPTATATWHVGLRGNSISNWLRSPFARLRRCGAMSGAPLPIPPSQTRCTRVPPSKSRSWTVSVPVMLLPAASSSVTSQTGRKPVCNTVWAYPR